jgi:hypothetical protein
MRELLIISASTNAALFDLYCKQLGRGTLVDNLQDYYDRNFTGFDMVDFLCNSAKVARPKTALGYLEWMIDGSPTLRAIFRYVQEHHLGNKADGKLLLTEDVPMNALFWDWSLNMLLVPSHISCRIGQRCTSPIDQSIQRREANKSQGDGNSLWRQRRRVKLSTRLP